MNKDQGSGIIERVAYGLIMAVLLKLVARGYIDEDMATYLASGILAAAGSVWAWWINRPKAIAQSAAAIPGTTVITAKEIAVTTSEANIVSNEMSKVVPK